jgi:flagellin
MNFSVNTNSGAFIALQNLSNTGSQLSQTQNRISTGLKVSSTKDDSASFAIAQNLRADVGGLNSVKGSLARAKSTLDVGVNAAEAISDVLVSMKEKATAAMDAGVDAPSRTALQNDFNAMVSQLRNLVDTAEFNGSNILKDAGAGISALLTDSVAAGTTLDVANQGLDTATTGALSAFLTPTGTTAAAWATSTAAGTSKTAVDTAITSMNTVLSSLGSASRRVDAQTKFVGKLSDTIEGGIGNLVDADMARESAKLQSLQVKQQLGIQALSIANQAPQSVLGLFR